MKATHTPVECCYVCGRELKRRPVYCLFLEDDGNREVFAGSDCHRRAVKAGYDGIETLGGPRVFIEKRFAANYPAYSAATARATGGGV